jgi:hypothetical protein
MKTMAPVFTKYVNVATGGSNDWGFVFGASTLSTLSFFLCTSFVKLYTIFFQSSPTLINLHGESLKCVRPNFASLELY